MNDSDTWDLIPTPYLWVIDKLILAKRLGYNCGPAGLPVPKKDLYIVRPCVNFEMMSKNAKLMALGPEDTIPSGYFWCEIFKGRHLSFDYEYGRQILGVEGFRDDPRRLDRFNCWRKVTDQFKLPAALQAIAAAVPQFNVECIGDKVIECHFRHNDDFAGHDSEEIIPIWKESFYSSPCGDRIGFLLK